jgi:hypothetical protein
MNRQFVTVLTALVLLVTVTSCAGAPSEADIQATIAAGVAATSEARQANAPTAAPPTSAARTPTTAPINPPTGTPFAPAATAAPTAAAISAAAPEAPAAAPFGPASGGSAQQTVNIQLVLDASGSMAEEIGGETKIVAARRALEQVIAQLPDSAPNINVGFRVYGHLGDNSEVGRAVSCQSTELLVPVQGINKDLLRQQVNAFEPTGWTPITLALQKAAEDLRPGDNIKNIIIMVTDGIETCEGDPCAAAKALRESQAEVRIDVVGFGTTPEEDRSLRCIADNAGGTYTNVQSGDVLVQSLQQLMAATVRRSYLRVVLVGPDGQRLSEEGRHPWQGAVELTSITDTQGQRPPSVATGALGGEGRVTPLEARGDQTYELPPGTYRFTVRQALGWNGQKGDLPLVNTEQTYGAVVAEGQETVAAVGIGSLRMEADGGEPEYACDLQLEVALGGAWQPVYTAVDGFCSRDSEGRIVQGGDLSFKHEYPLLPGRYRVVDVRRGQVLADTIDIQPGRAVTLQVRGLERAAR